MKYQNVLKIYASSPSNILTEFYFLKASNVRTQNFNSTHNLKRTSILQFEGPYSH